MTADSESLTFSVTGYGHGVGMSQYGANALAKERQTLSGHHKVVLHRRDRGPDGRK